MTSEMFLPGRKPPLFEQGPPLTDGPQRKTWRGALSSLERTPLDVIIISRIWEEVCGVFAWHFGFVLDKYIAGYCYRSRSLLECMQMLTHRFT